MKVKVDWVMVWLFLSIIAMVMGTTMAGYVGNEVAALVCGLVGGMSLVGSVSIAVLMGKFSCKRG